MVRKWSYLNAHSLSNDHESFNPTASFYRFKVFRKTTRFKRFNRGLTRMVRRNYARRKHQTNHVVLSFITKCWAVNYLQVKQFERFYGALGRFQISAFSAHADVFHLRLPNVSNHEGINVVSCSRPILNRHINYADTAAFLKNPTKGTNPTLVQTLTPLALTQSTEIYANVINFDNSLFCYESTNATLSQSESYAELFNGFSDFGLTYSLNTVLPLYHTLILLTLLNNHRNDPTKY